MGRATVLQPVMRMWLATLENQFMLLPQLLPTKVVQLSLGTVSCSFGKQPLVCETLELCNLELPQTAPDAGTGGSTIGDLVVSPSGTQEVDARKKFFSKWLSTATTMTQMRAAKVCHSTQTSKAFLPWWLVYRAAASLLLMSPHRQLRVHLVEAAMLC